MQGRASLFGARYPSAEKGLKWPSEPVSGSPERLELGAFKFVKFSIGRKMYIDYNHNLVGTPMISFTEHFKYHLLYFIIYQGAGTCSTPYRLNPLPSSPLKEAGEHQPTGEGGLS